MYLYCLPVIIRVKEPFQHGPWTLQIPVLVLTRVSLAHYHQFYTHSANIRYSTRSLNVQWDPLWYLSPSTYSKALPAINDNAQTVSRHVSFLFQHIERAPYDLEQLLDNIANEYSDEVKLAMLTATIKLFFKRPPECQELIGRLLRHCIGMYFI